MRKTRAWSTLPCLAVAAPALMGFALATAAPPADQQPAAPRLFAEEGPAAGEGSSAQVDAAAKSVEHSDESLSKYVKRINVKFDPKTDSLEQLDAKYDEFFKNHLVYPRVVFSEVRRLLARSQEGKESPAELDQILALLNGAIRNGQVQPWMYEAMGLTMQLKEMSQDDIERALMSAADFTNDPRAKIAMADYLSRMDFQDRAVDLYRQVGDAHSLNTATFEKVLSLSENIQDGEATEWAALGILRRAARRDEMELWKRAFRIARTRLETLRVGDDQTAADRFDKELAEALRRDLIVVVSWNGDADVDLMVEEPGGTTCSFRNPRTAGGGVMTGSLADTLERSSGEERSEMYVCPQGFSGKYRVMVRHIWGRIPSGKVTVDVFGSQGNDRIGHERQQLALGDKPSLISFELPEGRRQDSLEQHQLINDIKTQFAINQVASNRALLAQQISTVSAAQRSGDGSLSLDRDLTPVQDPAAPNFGQRRSTGFAPVVSLLPEGTTMSVNAVISANRKYVRITALPFFSSIGDVTEFDIGVPPEDDEFNYDIRSLRVDEAGRLVTGEGCILIDSDGTVINEMPPCVLADRFDGDV